MIASAPLPSAFTPSTASAHGGTTLMKHTQRAVEMKFLVPAEAVEIALACARHHLDPDPHADPVLGDGYAIHTLYFDTDDYDVYYRRGPYRNAKYRIRRYGSEAMAHLERKSKPEGRVRKHRTPVPLRELACLDDPLMPETWAGTWFRRRLQTLRLRPVCQLSYVRVARVGFLEGQPIRFTLDRGVQGVLRDSLAPPAPLAGLPLFPQGEAVVEIKFTEALPSVLRRLVDDLGLEATSLSKYRRGIKLLANPARSETPPTRSETLPTPLREAVGIS